MFLVSRLLYGPLQIYCNENSLLSRNCASSKILDKPNKSRIYTRINARIKLKNASWYSTLEHFIWLQPSFFCIGLLQFGQGFEFVTNHKKLAASSLPLQEAFSSSGFTSVIFSCHSCHCLHPQGAWDSPKSSNLIVNNFVENIHLNIPNKKSASFRNRPHEKWLELIC